MTNYQHKKGNKVIKYAMLCAIEDIMKRNATAKFTWLDEGFAYEKDMLHFTSGGHKCVLLGVGCPLVDDGVLPLVVRTDWEGEKGVRVDVNLNVKDIHIATLEKIACEVYNTLWNSEEDDEWDIYRDELVSNFLDTYR